jgi:hypothetical protein
MTFRDLIRNVDLTAYRHINESALAEEDRLGF